MQSFLTQAGYLALILFAFVEACSIPISSEITFGFAGVLAYQGHLNLVLVIVIGTLAELAGSFVSYAVGRKGGRRAVERYGRYVLITQRDLDRAERFFNGRGAWAVTVARLVPLLRAFAGLAAGLVEVPVGPFAVFNLIGTVIWAAALSSIGYAVGSAWSSVSKYLSLGGYVLAALIIAALVGVILLRLREFRREKAAGGPAAAGAAGPGSTRPAQVITSMDNGDLANPAPGDGGAQRTGPRILDAPDTPSTLGAPEAPAAPPASHRRTSRRR
jgi:membrane protein DedA with SNARE-associated domain